MLRAFFFMLGMAQTGTAWGHGDAGAPAWLQPPLGAVSQPEEGYRLRPKGDGYVYEAGTFKAKVGRDGVVAFDDKRVSAKFLLPIPQATPAGTPTLEGTLRDRFGRHRRQTAFPAKPVPAVPTIQPEDICVRGMACYLEPLGGILVQVGGTFDITDEIMRGLGEDPYRVEKARFLAATFDLRMRLAAAAQKSALALALDRLPKTIKALWADERYTARERRRILFELWRESDQGSDGLRARGVIEKFVRKRLPDGSPDAYTPGELEAFRAAAPDFSPYGVVPHPPNH